MSIFAPPNATISVLIRRRFTMVMFLEKLLGYDFGMGATLLAMFTILKKRHVDSCEVLKVLQYCWNLGSNLVFGTPSNWC